MKQFCIGRLRNLPFMAVACLISGLALGQEDPFDGTLEIHSIQTSPQTIVEGQQFQVTISGYNVARYKSTLVADPSTYSVSNVGSLISIESEARGPCTSPPLPLPSNSKAETRTYTLEGLPAGEYTLTVDHTVGCGDFNVVVETDLVVYVNDLPPPVVNLETPENSNVHSGVGLIRGWACYAKDGYTAPSGPVVGTVAVVIGENDPLPVFYGTPRADASAICGESNLHVGFGTLVYWGNYGVGEHDVTVLVDGVERVTRSFSVAAPEEGFLKDVVGSFTIEDFPSMEQSVDIVWSEADQNFRIVNFR